MRHSKAIALSLVLLSSVFAISGCGKVGSNSAASSMSSEPISLHANEEKCAYSLDIYTSMYLTIHLQETIAETNVAGLTFSATSLDTSGVTLSAVQDNGDVNVFSTGKIGSFKVGVSCFLNGTSALEYQITINVVDNSPAPTKIKDIPDQVFDAPKLINGGTNFSFTLDLSEYIDASDYVTYQMNCADSSVSMSLDVKKATFRFGTFGEKNLTLKALMKEEVSLEMSFKVTLNETIGNQLFNGSFEDGWDGWDASEWDKSSYSIIDSEVDIWGNRVNNDGKYLYGYTNEAGTADFHSSLFKAGGNRLVTFSMGGNGTNDLQLRLMKYVEGGAGVEVAKYNNWYYPKYSGSGFIMRKYFFYIPEANLGDDLYFNVYDQRTSDFGFIDLDSIVTYYTSEPANMVDFYKAGYCTDPDGLVLDMSDTSTQPFTALDQVANQLPNGDFESGYDHWFMTENDKKAYAIYGSATDIWGNPVHATKNYLYGYANESYTGTFHSDLFKVGGTGLITFKLAGFHTDDLQFNLMKHVEGGTDVLVEHFNNWYCNPDVRDHSGFIMQNYWYYINLDTYQDAYCYFQVVDSRKTNFGFLSIDDIVTYYETNPSMSEDNNWYKAGYINDPR